MDDEKKVLCETCEKNEGLELHSCPFQSEINDDDDFRCNCCYECTDDCAGDI